MRLFLIFCLLSGSGCLLAQHVYQSDRFDFEGSYDAYKNVYAKFREEHIRSGSVKEIIRKRDSAIQLQLRFNKRGDIIEQREFVDKVRLRRISTYRNRRIVQETEFDSAGTKYYVLYKYDKADRLISTDYTEKKKSNKPKFSITCSYNNRGQLVLRKDGAVWETRFVYEGDSIAWKLLSDKNKVLREVAKRLKRPGYELVTYFDSDTISNDDFRKRITPRKAFERRWDRIGNVIEDTEFHYDSAGKPLVAIAKKYEYRDSLLVKAIYDFHTDLKGESTKEYTYTDKGLLESKTDRSGKYYAKYEFKYDEHGNAIFDTGSKIQYFYDKHDNWILKQGLCKANSPSVRIQNGVMITQKFEQDTWVTEEQREIKYF